MVDLTNKVKSINDYSIQELKELKLMEEKYPTYLMLEPTFVLTLKEILAKNGFSCTFNKIKNISYIKVSFNKDGVSHDLINESYDEKAMYFPTMYRAYLFDNKDVKFKQDILDVAVFLDFMSAFNYSLRHLSPELEESVTTTGYPYENKYLYQTYKYLWEDGGIVKINFSNLNDDVKANFIYKSFIKVIEDYTESIAPVHISIYEKLESI